MNHQLLKGIMLCSATFAITSAASLIRTNTSQASALTNTELQKVLAPKKASYGYYINQYKSNTSTDVTPQDNAATALFNNSFSKYWDPASNGTKLNAKILNENQQKSVTISQNQTAAESLRSYLSDRRDSSYNEIPALGPFANAFVRDADAKTNFTAFPSKPWPATAKDDPSSGVIWASDNSKLGSMVRLVNLTASQTYSSSGNPKKYFKYVRPFRQGPGINMNKYLVAVFNATPATDYDFPSGHTTQAFETALIMGYTLPQRFSQEVTRASEVGYDRVLVGRHSPLAVMGGRVLGTAVAAAALNDSSNSALIKKAYSNAQTVLANKPDKNAADDYNNYQTNLKNYDARMTYGFETIDSKKTPMSVPKGAEILLKTRFPYLNVTQRREILYTTGFKAGYPINDDTEGWGRLNLVKADGGFGKLLTNTIINMKESSKPYSKNDIWRNNVGGQGSLTKAGNGTLSLEGTNTFSGTTIKGGTLIASNTHALGSGKLNLTGGTLKLGTGKVKVQGNYAQNAKANLNVNGTNQLAIHGTAKLGGNLTVSVKSTSAKKITLLTFHKRSGKFDKVNVSSKQKHWHAKYTTHSVQLVR